MKGLEMAHKGVGDHRAWYYICRWELKQAPQFWGFSLSFLLLVVWMASCRRRRLFLRKQ